MLRLWQQLNRVPLQVALTFPLVLQAIVIFGGVGYLSFRNSQIAVNSLANQLRDELAARILQEFEGLLEPPFIISKINANSLLQGDLNLLTGQGEQQLWQQSQIFPSTNLIYCGTEADGAFLGVGQTNFIAQDNDLRILLSNADTDFYQQEYDIDRFGNRGSLQIQGDRPYDPRIRPWYTKAKVAGEPIWSDVYLDFDTGLPTITANVPVFATNNQELVGVCAADIILPKELNSFLSGLEISNSGIAFLVDQKGRLISSSTTLSDHSPSPTEDGLVIAFDSSNRLIRDVSQYLTKFYGGLDQVESGQLNFWLDRDRYFLEVIRLRDDYGLDWIIILAMPEADFMEQINKSATITLFLSILMLIAALIVGFLLTIWLTRPLSKLSVAATAIAKGEWDRPIAIDRADAIGGLSRSIAAMAQQLKDLFTTLEHRIEERTQALTQANHELQRLANIDGLTQVANRRYFDERLQQEWQRLSRSQAPLTLIICDIDYFKQYNDFYGHQAGDSCLQVVAEMLDMATQRASDLVARYGGEEFALILPETDQTGGICMTQKLEKLLADLDLAHEASPYQRITASFGIATVIPSPDRFVHDLIEAADRALYAAKSASRNCYKVGTVH